MISAVDGAVTKAERARSGQCAVWRKASIGESLIDHVERNPANAYGKAELPSNEGIMLAQSDVDASKVD